MPVPPRACPFCEIIRGEAVAYRVLVTDSVCAFLDARPLFLGHVLIVPREHHETLGDLPEALVQPLFASVRTVALAVERGLGAEGTFVALNNRVSQSVAHLHVHVVPRRRGDKLRGFFWPRHMYSSDEEMRDYARLITDALATRTT